MIKTQYNQEKVKTNKHLPKFPIKDINKTKQINTQMKMSEINVNDFLESISLTKNYDDFDLNTFKVMHNLNENKTTDANTDMRENGFKTKCAPTRFKVRNQSPFMFENNDVHKNHCHWNQPIPNLKNKRFDTEIDAIDDGIK